MAGIDKFIEVVAKHGADGLVFDAGQRAIIVSGESRRYVTAQAVTESQIQELVREILPEDMARVRSTEAGREFDYGSPAGPVQVRLRRHAGRTRTEIVLAKGEAADEPEAAEAAEAEEPLAAATGAVGSWTQDDIRTPREEPRADAPPAEPPPQHSPHSMEPSAAQRSAEMRALANFAETFAAPRSEESLAPPRAAETFAAERAIENLAPARPEESSGPPLGLAAARSQLASGPQARPQIERLFEKMVQQRCTDLHLCVGSPPVFRMDGEITTLGEQTALGAGEIRDLVLEITPQANCADFDARNDTDFSYEMNEEARFRVNLFHDRRGLGAVFRFIPGRIPTPQELGLSKSVLELCLLPKGLVLITGPTGSGKSTTLASLIDHINGTRAAHIITIEDPIEFVYANKRSLVNQREVGAHTESFKSALRAALREDPDIVLVGELRDLETVTIALETAETGHLVFGTLHTNTAPSAIDRIIDQFPSDRQAQVRTMLSDTLRGVIAQSLVKRRGGGLVAAQEVLLVNAAVSNLIREGKTFQIPSVIQTGRAQGMVTMDDALLGLVSSGLVEAETALAKAPNRTEFKLALDRLQDQLGSRETRRAPAAV